MSFIFFRECMVPR